MNDALIAKINELIQQNALIIAELNALRQQPAAPPPATPVATAVAPEPDRAHPMVRKLFRKAELNYLTLMDLARATRTHHSILNRWKNGETAPRITTLDRIADVVSKRAARLRTHPEELPMLQERFDRAQRYQAAAALRPASVTARARRNGGAS